MRALRWSGRAAVFAAVAMLCAGLGTAPEMAVASTPVQMSPAAAPSVVRAKAVTAGFVDSCALTTKGAVKCWGYNGEGELGDNTTTDSAKPVRVYGLGKGVKAISAGSYFTCALTTQGAVKCWGSNAYGQLGDNTTTDSAKPVQVYSLGKGVKAISAGNFFACALTTKGAVKCWGANTYGQLGNGTTTSSAKPVAVHGFTKGGMALGAGGYHACAVTIKRAVKCWGYNGDGELGDNTTTSATKPVAAYRLTKRVKAIAYGDIHGCALTTAGRVKCWGYNGYGALGDNSTTSSPKAVGVYNMGAKINGIAAGGYHSCAVTTKGLVKCWGFNAYGELGDGTVVTSHKPVGVFGMS